MEIQFILIIKFCDLIVVGVYYFFQDFFFIFNYKIYFLKFAYKKLNYY